jgi:hypothetical protein
MFNVHTVKMSDCSGQKTVMREISHSLESQEEKIVMRLKWVKVSPRTVIRKESKEEKERKNRKSRRDTVFGPASQVEDSQEEKTGSQRTVMTRNPGGEQPYSQEERQAARGQSWQESLAEDSQEERHAAAEDSHDKKAWRRIASERTGSHRTAVRPISQANNSQ